MLCPFIHNIRSKNFSISLYTSLVVVYNSTGDVSQTSLILPFPFLADAHPVTQNLTHSLAEKWTPSPLRKVPWIYQRHF